METSKIEIRNDIVPKHYFGETKSIINYAFSIGEKHYFQYDDPLNAPYARPLKALVYYRELDCNADGAYMDAHTKAMDGLLDKAALSFSDVLTMKQLNDQLKQRRLLPKLPELLYKLAAVVFFDQFENPVDYEFGYGEKKIKFWKETTSLTDFFLLQPLVVLIPYLKHAGADLEIFSRVAQGVDKLHLETLVPLLPPQLKELKQTLSTRLDYYASI